MLNFMFNAAVIISFIIAALCLITAMNGIAESMMKAEYGRTYTKDADAPTGQQTFILIITALICGLWPFLI